MKFEDKVKGLREKKYKGKETEAFLSDVVLMAKGEAYEYLLGEVVFLDTKVDLTFRPMIPRKETEFWLQECILFLKKKDLDKADLLDVFTGSGALGLALLNHFPRSNCDFVDVYAPTEEQVKISLKKNKIDTSRASIYVTDIEHFFVQCQKKYNVIVAVPPYVNSIYKEEVMKELSAEKEGFFFDKEDGLYYYEVLLREGKNVLTDKGCIFIEFDYFEKERLTNLIEKYAYEILSFFKDQYNNDSAVCVAVNGR